VDEGGDGRRLHLVVSRVRLLKFPPGTGGSDVTEHRGHARASSRRGCARGSESV
jgi:hypothetical protein